VDRWRTVTIVRTLRLKLRCGPAARAGDLPVTTVPGKAALPGFRCAPKGDLYIKGGLKAPSLPASLDSPRALQ